MTTYTEMLGKAAALFQKARETLNDPKLSVEQRQHVTEMIADAKELQRQALEVKELEEDTAAVMEQIKQAQTPAEQQRGRETRGSSFRDWGEYLTFVKAAESTGRVDARLRPWVDVATSEERKDLVEGVGASGGFLVPEEFQTQLMQLMGESALIRPRATIIRMRRRTMSIPVLDQTNTTAGVAPWFGGMQVYWTEEAGEKTQTEPSFRRITLTAHKMAAYTRASDELLDDAAISLADFLSGPMGFAGAIAWHEDYAFLRGSGAGQPQGVLNSDVTLTQTRDTSSQINYEDDLVGMVAKFLPGANGVWLASQSAMTQLMTLNGPSGNPSFLWGDITNNGMPGTLMGYPIVFTEKLPALGTEGDLGLYDFRYYLVGDRQATTVESTIYDRWRYDETSWRCVHRVDGQPWLSTPITLQDGSTQVSPFVVLS